MREKKKFPGVASVSVMVVTLRSHSFTASISLMTARKEKEEQLQSPDHESRTREVIY